MIGASDGDLNSHIYDTWCVLIRVFIQMNFGLLIYCCGRMRVQISRKKWWEHYYLNQFDEFRCAKGWKILTSKLEMRKNSIDIQPSIMKVVLNNCVNLMIDRGIEMAGWKVQSPIKITVGKWWRFSIFANLIITGVN